MRSTGVFVVVPFLQIIGECFENFNAVRVQVTVPRIDKYECYTSLEIGQLLNGNLQIFSCGSANLKEKVEEE